MLMGILSGFPYLAFITIGGEVLSMIGVGQHKRNGMIILIRIIFSRGKEQGGGFLTLVYEV